MIIAVLTYDTCLSITMHHVYVHVIHVYMLSVYLIISHIWYTKFEILMYGLSVIVVYDIMDVQQVS